MGWWGYAERKELRNKYVPEPPSVLLFWIDVVSRVGSAEVGPSEPKNLIQALEKK